MIGCFNHGPFNFIANKTINSTFFKTKYNEVCDRRNNFVNHPCRYNKFCIIFSPPKNFVIFVRWKSFNKFRQKKIKNRQNVNQERSKILFSVPQQPLGTMESTKFFTQLPPTCLLHPSPQPPTSPNPPHPPTHPLPPHTHKQNTHKPLVTPRNSSYAVA